jgi:hypothetical protein
MVTSMRLAGAAGYVVTVHLNGVTGVADFVLAQRGSHVVLLVYSDDRPPARERLSALSAAALSRLDR